MIYHDLHSHTPENENHMIDSSRGTTYRFSTQTFKNKQNTKTNEVRMGDQQYPPRANNHLHYVYIWRMSGKFQEVPKS